MLGGDVVTEGLGPFGPIVIFFEDAFLDEALKEDIAKDAVWLRQNDLDKLGELEIPHHLGQFHNVIVDFFVESFRLGGIAVTEFEILHVDQFAHPISCFL